MKQFSIEYDLMLRLSNQSTINLQLNPKSNSDIMECNHYIRCALAEKIADDINRLIRNAIQEAQETSDLSVIGIEISNTNDKITLIVDEKKNVTFNAGIDGMSLRIDDIHMIYAMDSDIWFESNENWFIIGYEKIIQSISNQIYTDNCNFD